MTKFQVYMLKDNLTDNHAVPVPFKDAPPYDLKTAVVHTWFEANDGSMYMVPESGEYGTYSVPYKVERCYTEDDDFVEYRSYFLVRE